MTTIFSDAFTGSNGAAWSASWTSSVTDAGASSTIQTNRGRLAAGTSSGGQVVRRYSGANVTNSEFSGTFIINTSSTSAAIEIWIRGDDATNNGNGYFLVLNIGSKPLLAKGAGFTYPSIATLTSAPTIAQSTEYGFKLYAVGSTIKAKVWLFSGSEPAYDFSGTDTTHSTAGQTWLRFGNGGGTASQTADFNDVLLTDGNPALAAAGTSAAVVGVSGNAILVRPAAGVSAAVVTLTGDATIIPAIPPAAAAGTATATTTVVGDARIIYGVSGTVTCTSTTTGTLGASIRAVSGAVAAVATTTGTTLGRFGVSGTVAVVASTSGILGKIASGAAGTVVCMTVVRGSTLVTGKPGQGAEVLVLFDPNEVLTGGRVTYYQFDLLDPDENLVGQLQGVEGGDISFDAYAAIKSGGMLTVYTDPSNAHLPDGQPDFLGVQINTPLGPQATSTGAVSSPPFDHVIAVDTDATDVSFGDRVILTDSTGQPKESTAFTVTQKTSGGGFTTISFTPDAQVAIASGDILKVVSVGFQRVVDWLNVRIRPMIRIARLGGGDDPLGTLVPAGVFLCAAPVEKWEATGLRRKVELADKLSILDQDIASGDPILIEAYVAPAGSNIITLVQTLIGETGELYPAIQPDSKVLAAPLVWDIGTTRLKIINDLLDAAGYFSLFCDGYGQYQAVPYVQPSDRVPVYDSIAPFSDGPQSLMDPAWTRDRDIYSVPNRYLVVGQGDSTTAALTSLATNVDPASPYSFPSRGRWITQVETGVEAVDQSALDTIARARLSRATSVTNQIELKHVFLPDLHINSVVHFTNPGSGLDVNCYVVATTIVFNPTALCTTKMRVVG